MYLRVHYKYIKNLFSNFGIIDNIPMNGVIQLIIIHITHSWSKHWHHDPCKVTISLSVNKYTILFKSKNIQYFYYTNALQSSATVFTTAFFNRILHCQTVSTMCFVSNKYKCILRFYYQVNNFQPSILNISTEFRTRKALKNISIRNK